MKESIYQTPHDKAYRPSQIQTFSYFGRWKIEVKVAIYNATLALPSP